MVDPPDTAVKESDDRVFSALANSGFRRPKTRTTINFATGDLKKEGTMYDLPIALGILESTSQMSASERSERSTIEGELSLSGAVRAIRGGLAFGIQAQAKGQHGVILSVKSTREASLIAVSKSTAWRPWIRQNVFLKGNFNSPDSTIRVCLTRRPNHLRPSGIQ